MQYECIHMVTCLLNICLSQVLLWMVSGCALETDVCHWMFKTKANMVQGEEDLFICLLVKLRY